LIVIASGITDATDWPEKAHAICFSDRIDRLPGPIDLTYLYIPDNAETEEILFPDVPLPISQRRNADYGNLKSIRGWPRLNLNFDWSPKRGITQPQLDAARKIFNNGAIICEHHTKSPLAVAFIREGSNHGVGWLPSVDKNQSAWVELLVTEWAQSDKGAFPNFGDWTNSPEWMVLEEEQILSQIEDLEIKKQKSIIEIDQKIDELKTKLAIAKTNANKGRRRLITAQGDELVDEVAKALEDIGFSVTVVDELIGDHKPRREDLRLCHSDKMGEEWNAIVEVRGYARSAGNTGDLLRLARFAKLYQQETRRAPDKCIYIVNGQLELPQPSQRQAPLASAPEDLQEFSENDGILIWSVDLFRALKSTNSVDYPVLLESIKNAQGRWIPVIIPSPPKTN